MLVLGVFSGVLGALVWLEVCYICIHLSVCLLCSLAIGLVGPSCLLLLTLLRLLWDFLTSSLEIRFPFSGEWWRLVVLSSEL